MRKDRIEVGDWVKTTRWGNTRYGTIFRTGEMFEVQDIVRLGLFFKRHAVNFDTQMSVPLSAVRLLKSTESR